MRKAGSRGQKRTSGFAWRVLGLTCLLCMLPFLIDSCARQQEPATLRLYSGAGLRLPVDEIAKLFQQEYKVKLECVYSGASHLVSQVKLTRTGDLFMPGDAAYVDQAEKEGLILEKKNVCYFEPVILVAKGNPKNITSVEDLLKPGVRLGLGDPRAIPIGKKTLRIFANSGIDKETVEKNLKFSAVTVNALGDAVKLGTIDATIVWDAVAFFYKNDTEVVRIPPEQNVISTVTVGILRFTKQRQLARQFVGLLTSERGQKVFEKYGYTVENPSASAAPRRLHVFFSGRVQGVGFRASTRGLARQFKVTGFVRNLKDGRVELVAEGTPTELQAFLQALKELRKKNIERTEQTWRPATGEFQGFGIRP